MPGKITQGTVGNVNLDPAVGPEIQKTRQCVVTSSFKMTSTIGILL